MLGIILGWRCWRCGSLETLEDGEGPGNDCAGGRGGGGGPQSFCCRVGFLFTSSNNTRLVPLGEGMEIHGTVWRYGDLGNDCEKGGGGLAIISLYVPEN